MNLTYQVQKDHRYNNLNEEPHFEQFEIFSLILGRTKENVCH